MTPILITGNIIGERSLEHTYSAGDGRLLWNYEVAIAHCDLKTWSSETLLGFIRSDRQDRIDRNGLQHFSVRSVQHLCRRPLILQVKLNAYLVEYEKVEILGLSIRIET